jgi:hypothetical protein
MDIFGIAPIIAAVQSRKKAPVAKTRTPIPPEVVQALKPSMKHRFEWTCGCGAVLAIRSREPRADGPSNFHPHPTKPGHSAVSAALLNWHGLAEERGWKVHPKTVCPACQAGMSVKEYKIARREGRL